MKESTWIKLMELGEYFGCHQMAERSFFYKKHQFPVCARCTGVLISTVLAAFIFFKKKIHPKICIAMSSVMFLDWLIQYLGIRESNNKRRLVTGFIGGLGYSTLHLYLYQYIANMILKRVKK